MPIAGPGSETSNRILTVYRLALAALLLWDLFDRAHALGAFGNGSTLTEALLLAATACAALAFAIGWRGSAVVCWALTLFLHQRNSHILYGADDALRMLLFWAIFLPTRLGDFGSRLQLAVIFIVAALHKLADPIWREGLGLDQALGALASGAGDWLRELTWLTPSLSYLAIAIQLLAPLGLFVRRREIRWISAGLLIALQIGIIATMDVGFFPWVTLAACLLFFTPPSLTPHGQMKAAVLASFVVLLPFAESANLKRVADQPLNLGERLIAGFGWNQSWLMFTPAPREHRAYRLSYRDLSGVSTTVADPAGARIRWGLWLFHLSQNPPVAESWLADLCARDPHLAEVKLRRISRSLEPSAPTVDEVFARRNCR